MRFSLPLGILTALIPVSIASAQYTSDFEKLSASAAGTAVTGQGGYYIPPGTTSVDFLAYTYAGNTLGFPANPAGGQNFIAGTGPASSTYARAQINTPYRARFGVWTAAFDIAANFQGTLPTAQNAGSFSVQPFPGSQSFIALARWTDTATAANWNADYIRFDAAGNQVTTVIPDTNFQTLATNSWYRWETDFDLGTNQIVEVRLTDLTSMTAWTHTPKDWYLDGGAAGNAIPTGFRFFGGGSVAGNTLAFDNPSVTSTAGYSSYGSGCAGTGGGNAPTLAGVAPNPTPRVGLPFTLEMNNLPVPASLAFIAIGFTDQTWNGSALPFDLSIVGATSCSLLTDIVFALPVASANGTGSLLMAVPNDPGLIDASIFSQGLIFAPGANPLGFIVSNGGRGSISN